MSEPDVVAELDAWLNKDPWRGVLDRTTAQRARDEIVALRALVEQPLQHTTAWAAEIRVQARAKALEEAAQLCEQDRWEIETPGDCAAAIRGLKEPPG